MKVDTPALGAGFRRSDGQGNDAVKYAYTTAIGFPKQFDDLSRVVGSHVGHGDKDACDLQPGIDFPLHI